MRGLRQFSFILFIISLALFLIFVIYSKIHADITGPKLTVDEDVLEVSVKDDEKALLKGVKAMDAQDGDVSDSLVVENLSNFTTKGHRIITYAAFDSNQNVGKISREIQYTDYESPVFKMTEAPEYSQSELNKMEDFSGIIQAEDCLDGDLSRMITMSTLRDYEETQFGGKQELEFKVSNSAGDVVSIPVTVSFHEVGAPVVRLSSYIAYVKKGARFDPNGYLKGATAGNEEYNMTEFREKYTDQTLTIKNGVNTAESGNYQVSYTVTTGSGNQIRGSTVYLQVVVQ